MKKPSKYDQKRGVRRLARERVGSVPSTRVIEPKDRRKPKHKKAAADPDEPLT